MGRETKDNQKEEKLLKKNINKGKRNNVRIEKMF